MPERSVVPLPDDETLDEALAYFSRHLAFRRRFEQVPGIQAAVFARGTVRLAVSDGSADLEAGTALDNSHLFRIASHSKTFTATAILQLVEKGALRLDDPAGQWVDDLAGTPIGEVTVRDLLSHSSGMFRDGRNGDFWQLDGQFLDRDKLRDALLDPDALIIGTNERFKYSNIAYSLAGLIIESATGASYNEWVREAIIDHLGLSDTGPELDPERAARYATGYSARAYSPVRVPIDHVDTRAMAAATGFYSTATDLVQYFSAHFIGDDRLLTDASKRQMQHPWWSVGGGQDRHYGLGLSVATVGDRVLIGHGGGYPGHITSSVADTRAGLAISVLTNSIDGPAESLAHACVKLIDLAGSRPRPAVTPPVPADRFAGTFASLWGVVDIAVLGGRLYRLHAAAVDPTEEAAELEIVDGTTLRVAGGIGYGAYGELFRFTFDDDGAVSSVRGESGMTLTPLESFALPARVTVR